MKNKEKKYVPLLTCNSDDGGQGQVLRRESPVQLLPSPRRSQCTAHMHTKREAGACFVELGFGFVK
jgi:hypothetical protein